ncbi:hypothetical protein GCM10009416_14830 [Craurococcus roseus]|uniref:Uncharacterized protein n=1 Tax=Craurococcus roseus TaxID=77585 RepID=A0ABP3Q1A2_9PROT
MRKLLGGIRAARATRIWPEVTDPTDAQRAAMPHGVDCEGVTVHDLGPIFGAELHRLKRWCREHREGAFSVEPIRDPATRQDTGRRFRFSRLEDAALFRLSCL